MKLPKLCVKLKMNLAMMRKVYVSGLPGKVMTNWCYLLVFALRFVSNSNVDMVTELEIKPIGK